LIILKFVCSQLTRIFCPFFYAWPILAHVALTFTVIGLLVSLSVQASLVSLIVRYLGRERRTT